MKYLVRAKGYIDGRPQLPMIEREFEIDVTTVYAVSSAVVAQLLDEDARPLAIGAKVQVERIE